MGFLRPYWLYMVGAYAAVFAANGISIWMPLVIRGIIDDGVRPGAVPRIVSGCLLLVIIAVVHGVCTFVTGVWTETASQNVAFDLRNRFHEKLQSMSFSFHDEAETGQLLARSVSDVDRIRFLTGRAFLNLTQMLTLVLGISVAMIAVNVHLALITLTVAPLIILSALILGSVLRPLSVHIRDEEANLTSLLEQNLRGSRIVKAFGREAAEIGRFENRNRELLALQLREARIRSTHLPLMELLASTGTLLVLLFGGRMVMGGSLTLGELVAFMAYIALLINPGRRFGWVVAAISQASASAERIFEILDLPSSVEDLPGARPLVEVRGWITFEGVSFGYGRGSRVLDTIDIDIAAGEKIAILGSTGSGKSSFVNLIPRFYDPVDGVVKIDGTDIREFTVRSLRDHIGVVLQDTVLFASTIRENIAFGRPDATFQDIENAARAAHIHDFIASLPDGYDTKVGEKGVSLSGGQKQRLAIARAILKDPEILILDDATSSVDTHTEEHIREALRQLMRDRTAVIIAQRLSTIREADRVIVLDQGRIVAEGRRTEDETPHEQLLRVSPLYAEIHAHQLRPAECSAENSGSHGGDAHD